MVKSSVIEGGISNENVCDQVKVQLRKKKRKPTKLEIKNKLTEAIPIKERWWTVWGCDPSHTVASVVAEQPNFRPNTTCTLSTPDEINEIANSSVKIPSIRDETEEIWNMNQFDKAMRLWMRMNKEAKFVNPFLFSR